MKKIIIGIIPFLLFCCNSKDDDCSRIDIPCECSSFVLLDSIGHSLVGNTRRYTQDSISILNQNDKIRLSFRDSVVDFYFSDWEENETYTLKIGNHINYEMTLDLKVITNDCFTVREIDDFIVNDEKIAKEGTYHYLIR